MKKDYLYYIIIDVLNFITFTLCSLNFLAGKKIVLFAISLICVFFTMFMLCLCIKEIRTKDSDSGENKLFPGKV